MARMDERRLKIGICVPYRNREQHLSRFIPHLSNFLQEQDIDFKFYIANQIDDKLFNRGAMKNLAAKAAFEDGCDYIAWHDIDMLPHSDADYSYPKDTPIHIATKLSKYNYGMGYEQYFGGVVLFTEDQVKKVNGYSNQYWDWGQEDDDLFWRCYLEGYTTGHQIDYKSNTTVGIFDGNTKLEVNTSENISNTLSKEFTISITFCPEQQEDKVPIWLVGDYNRKIVEFPILRKSGSGIWGISFNNSRAISIQFFDIYGNRHYNWIKHIEKTWVKVDISYKESEQALYVYVNNKLSSQINGVIQDKPFPIPGPLAEHTKGDLILGHCPVKNTYFRGKISEFKLFDKFIDDIKPENELLKFDFNKRIETSTEDITISENITPFRRDGSFYCLPHKNEGWEGGKWAKGETTAANERRFVTQMQQGKIDYKKEGYNSVTYQKLTTEKLDDNVVMLNIEL